MTTLAIPQDVSDAYQIATDGQALGALWTANEMIYAFGNPDSATNSLPAFNTSTNTWSEVKVAGGDFNVYNRSGSLSVSTPNSGLSFILGGHEPFYMGGMIRFDASDPNDLSWTNETLGNGSFGVEVPNLDTAAFVYAPAGKEGILLAFGGMNVSEGIDPDWGWPYYSDFSQIYVYDIASHTWFVQEASGTAPSYINTECDVVSASPDGDAFHVTMYGGWSLQYGRSTEDVYVLSIPSFTWIDVSAAAQSSNNEALNSTIGRDSMTCQLYKDAQMIVLGGDIRSGAYSLTKGACSQVFEPIRVLDLSTYTWESSLNLNKTYEVPEAIYKVIGGK